MTMGRMICFLDRIISIAVSCGRWLALPVVVLLFLQWPLREFVGKWSREANDLGQWIFAIYVAVSVTAATRARAHLAADAIAQTYSGKRRRLLARLGSIAALVP